MDEWRDGAHPARGPGSPRGFCCASDSEDGFRLNVAGKSEDKVSLEFLAIPGRRYALGYSTNLTSWASTGFRLSTDGTKAALRADFVPVRTTLLRVEVPTAGVPAGAFFRATVQ